MLGKQTGKLTGEYNPQQPWTTGLFTLSSYVALKGVCSDYGKLLSMPY